MHITLAKAGPASHFDRRRQPASAGPPKTGFRWHMTLRGCVGRRKVHRPPGNLATTEMLRRSTGFAALVMILFLSVAWVLKPDLTRPMLADDPIPGVMLYENQTFWTLSPWDGSTIKTDSILLWVSATAYWYIERNLTESGSNFTADEMAYIGGRFDDVVVPRVHAAFGFEPRPPQDVDGDARITVLITPALSIFMPRNEYPSPSEPYSNAKEMIYVRFDRNFGRFLGSVAHEFTHLVEWNYDSSEDAWI